MNYNKFIKSDIIDSEPLIKKSGKQGGTLYLLPKRLGGDGNYYSSSKGKFKRKLLEIDKDMTSQIYYDIMVLKLESDEDRPRCPIRNKPLKFQSLVLGYQTYCSLGCLALGTKDEKSVKISKSLSGRKLPESTRKKMPETHKSIPLSDGFIRGRELYVRTKVVSEESKQKISSSLSKYYIDHPEARLINPKRMIQYCKDRPEFIENFINSGVYNSKKGYYTSVESNITFYYRSSWELYLLKYMDSSDEIINIEKSPSIDYEFRSRHKLYYPDFLITLKSGVRVMIEVKPYHFLHDDKVVAKRLAALQYCRQNSIRYLTLTQYEIYSDNLSISGLLSRSVDGIIQ